MPMMSCSELLAEVNCFQLVRRKVGAGAEDQANDLFKDGKALLALQQPQELFLCQLLMFQNSDENLMWKSNEMMCSSGS